METLEHAVRLARLNRFTTQPQIKRPVEKSAEKLATPAQIASEVILPNQFLPRIFTFPRVKEIQKLCCQYFEFNLNEMLSEQRLGPLVRARQIAMYLTKTLTPHSYPEIGRRFGRDHTTVFYAVRKIGGLLSSDERLRAEVEHLANILRPKESQVIESAVHDKAAT